MKKTKISETELAGGLSDILSRVQQEGESFIVERNGHAIATVGPPLPEKSFTFGDLVELLRDLPRPDDRFADDLGAIQASQQEIEPPRWDS